jgi:post-segregation antitoxin (ccd killing protein)
MASTRTTFTLDDSTAEQAHRLGINVSAAARAGVIAAVRAAMIDVDRQAYARHPEKADEFWDDAEAWGDE